MTAIQQLERLYRIQEGFAGDESLESTVVRERLQSLIGRTEQLIQQRTYLRNERRRIRIVSDAIVEKKAAFANMARQDWKTLADADSYGRKIQLNVGGLIFEAPENILLRDPTSLLGQLCEPDPSLRPILPDKEGGFFVFDRDWWLFRFIMKFLRDGTLPDDRQLLAQLYRECSFWNLKSMQTAIEEQKLHLRPKENVEKPKEPAATAVWWRKLPSWWTALDEEKAKEKKIAEEDKKKEKKEDWWKDTSYRGKVFLPLSSDPVKVVTAEGAKDVKTTPSITWEALNYRSAAKDGLGGSYAGGAEDEWS